METFNSSIPSWMDTWPGVVHTPVIPAPARLRQEDGDFQASLGYIARSCLKKPKPHKGPECALS
jgi:hypothetical protein